MDKQTDKKPAGLRPRKFRRWFLYCFGVFIILLCADLTLAWWWRHVPISYQTTRITGPLRPDGTVDYITALNQISGKGVTPDNNAVIDLLEAVGTNSLPDDSRKEYLQLLGAQQMLPAQGKFQTLGQFTTDDKSYFSGVTAAVREKQIDAIVFGDYGHALKTGECPEVYKWVQSQQYSIALFKSASVRNYFYAPMVGGSPVSGGPISVFSPMMALFVSIRGLADAVATDAMYRIGDGDLSDAWDDALALHRMARVMSRSPTLIGNLIGLSVEGLAQDVDHQILENIKLDSGDVRQMMATFDQLQPMSRGSYAINLGERFLMLDNLSAQASGQSIFFGYYKNDEVINLIHKAVPFHYAMIMSEMNNYYDDVAQSFDAVTFEDAQKQIQDLHTANYLRGGFISGALVRILIATIGPSMERALRMEFVPDAAIQMDKTEFILAAWHADHGGYPAALTELVPDYLISVPIDPFDGQPLRYQQTANGYKLWSIGSMQMSLHERLFTYLQFTMPAAKQD
jgi:hypothetical protein